MKTQAVIFDMDGVLADSEPLICAAAMEMFRRHGINVQAEDFLPFVGAGENRYIGGVAEQYGVSLDITAAKAETYEIYCQLVPEQLTVFPGAVDFIEACRGAGLRCALASSADRIKIDANLEKIGIPAASWDALVSAEDVEKRKPHPDIFLKAASLLGIEPARCMVIEDALNGIEAALAAGMPCIAIATSFAPDQLGRATQVKHSIAECRLQDLP